MNFKDEIINIINKSKRTLEPVTEASNLYTELGFDSLAFVYLLVSIEEAYGISFELMEMERCLQVESLILLVESKVKERIYDSESID